MSTAVALGVGRYSRTIAAMIKNGVSEQDCLLDQWPRHGEGKDVEEEAGELLWEGLEDSKVHGSYSYRILILGLINNRTFPSREHKCLGSDLPSGADSTRSGVWKHPGDWAQAAWRPTEADWGQKNKT